MDASIQSSITMVTSHTNSGIVKFIVSPNPRGKWSSSQRVYSDPILKVDEYYTWSTNYTNSILKLQKIMSVITSMA